jgi:hypothetical protein
MESSAVEDKMYCFLAVPEMKTATPKTNTETKTAKRRV